ncbi:MAG: hypothetical protein HUU20_21495 [Pirellulales bacterium]|nr:hypothetical protein [Pirellulales bacterium]
MDLAPRPENDFRRFIETYFARCRTACPMIRAIAGKWEFEDLIPGLSDFDSRLIVDDAAAEADWARMSLAVGEVHTALAREEPQWARILEHLPGVNLTPAEAMAPAMYYPESRQWTFYLGDPRIIAAIQSSLESSPWSSRDELFHLKKIAVYFGPYQRGIDPPINLGPWQGKYPLHSRLMHYFAPPVQAAVSLATRSTVRGKLESLRMARGIFPQPHVIDRVLDAIACHYELPDLDRDPRLEQLERELESYLQSAWAGLAGSVTLVAVDPSDSRDDLRRKTAAVPSDPADAVHSGLRFSRLLKGRLLFYAQSIGWFDSEWLIRNELGRVVANLCTGPLAAYGRARFGAALKPEAVLHRLRGNLLAEDLCEGVTAFIELVGTPLPAGQERPRATQAAAAFDPVPAMLAALSADLLKQNAAIPTPAS